MSAIKKALRIADLTYFPLTFAERHECVEQSHNELAAKDARIAELKAALERAVNLIDEYRPEWCDTFDWRQLLKGGTS